MISQQKNKKQLKFYYRSFVYIFIFELLSLCVFLNQDYSNIIVIILSFTILGLSLIKLEYGVYLALIELFIGSKGYLFSFEGDGIVISIRIIIWLIVMSVWFKDFIIACIKNRKKLIHSILHHKFTKTYGILFIFIIWGFVNALLNKNSFNNIFFDMNGWLFFSYLFPFVHVCKNKETLRKIFNLFLACLLWISFKTLALLYIFTHEVGYNFIIYKWVRDTGIGEITKMPEQYGGFYRIFFQSHVYLVIGVIAIILLWLSNFRQKKINYQGHLIYFSVLICFMAVNIVSLSRSNWVGLVAGFVLLFLYILYLYNWKKLFLTILTCCLSFILAIGLINSIIKFPYPKATSELNASLITDRASQIKDEAGVSSRWSLLPKLTDKIKENPLLGSGYGTVITYKSSDPRILESNPDGNYTTFAFEWGWLDVWLKLGLFGVIVYAFFILKIFFTELMKLKKFDSDIAIYAHIMVIGLCIIASISMFSPYLNHPIGIGFMILSTIFTANNR